MKSEKLLEFIKDGSFNIPFYLFRLRSKLNISDFDFMFLAYLSSKGTKFLFNPDDISKSLNMSNIEIMTSISNLTDKHLVEMDSVKNEKGVMEEYVTLEQFYCKVTSMLVEDLNETDTENNNIYDIIMKEFGRTLSPMEYEIIKAWLDTGTSEDIIKEALKESIYNGVMNLRYIDKIIYEWGKKGFKTVEDVRRHNKTWKEEKGTTVEIKKESPKEVFDFDWFDDDEEHE